ncbi:MAG TPA: histidine kinase [Acidimicrobiales bacterium]|nr:histidine kinase [Acidimicrobiales bacterium]
MSGAEELQASRLRLLTSANQQRRTFERTLHDGPQQHLVALAVSVRLARTMAKSNPDAVDEVLSQLGDEVQTTLEELRELAHRIYPPLLEDRGLAHALLTAADRLPGTVDVGDVERLPSDVEAALYFASTDVMEQNGDVTLRRDGDGVHLTVKGAGLATTSLVDTVTALGGHITVDPAGAEAVIPL